MTARTFLLHLGYGKTGTSTLQRSFFDPLSKLGLIHYFGMFLEADKEHPDRVLFDRLQAAMYLNDDAFELEVPKLKDAFRDASQRSADHVPMVLSNEHFLLSAYSTRLEGVAINAMTTALRLSRVLEDFDVRLLAGFRRQDKFLHSLFVESAARVNHKNAGYFASLSDFLEMSLTAGTVFHPLLQYGPTMEAYRRAFPKSDFLVYLFEDFIADQSPVLSSILRLMALPGQTLDQFSLPLPNLNAKDKREDGVAVRERSGLVNFVRGLPLGNRVLNNLRAVPALQTMNEKSRPKRVIPNLSDAQSARILEATQGAAQHLMMLFPELADGMRRYGYVQ